MRCTILLSIIVSSVASAVVTALVFLVVLPPAVDAQVARLTGSGLSVVGPEGRAGVTAEVGGSGGGILRVFGNDGTTLRLSLNSSGPPKRNRPRP